METKITQPNIFEEFYEAEAIERIKKFSKICEKIGCIPVVGFSGGKDSQVVYDLCKRAKIPFKACFNHCFESSTTLHFIRTYYPEVEWRREIKQGFFENIRKNHNGILPTVELAYCCKDYKHNPKFVDFASITGVRKEESINRRSRRVLETRTKRFYKKNSDLIDKYFVTSCIASGAPSELQLKPIIDWSSDDVWNYIKKYKLPINPEYIDCNRVGCLICPKANLNSNYRALIRYPGLIDCVIRAREKSENKNIDWIITGQNKDYSDNKCMYVCMWLNHSFRALTKRQTKLAEIVCENYKQYKQNKGK